VRFDGAVVVGFEAEGLAVYDELGPRLHADAALGVKGFGGFLFVVSRFRSFVEIAFQKVELRELIVDLGGRIGEGARHLLGDLVGEVVDVGLQRQGRRAAEAIEVHRFAALVLELLGQATPGGRLSLRRLGQPCRERREEPVVVVARVK